MSRGPYRIKFTRIGLASEQSPDDTATSFTEAIQIAEMFVDANPTSVATVFDVDGDVWYLVSGADVFGGTMQRGGEIGRLKPH